MALHTDHAGVNHYDDIDFSHQDYDGYLSLHGTTVHGRMDAHGLTVDGNANFRNLLARGGVNAWSMDVAGNMNLSDAHIADLFLRSATTGKSLNAENLEVDGDMDLKRFAGNRITLQDSEVGGTMYLEDTEADYIDLRGATINQLWVDDLDAYEIRIDDDTWIGDFREGYGSTDEVSLSENGQELGEKIYDRPRFPIGRRDGVLFAYDELKRDLVMSYHQPFFANLVKEGAIRRLDDEHYLMRSDAL